MRLIASALLALEVGTAAVVAAQPPLPAAPAPAPAPARDSSRRLTRRRPVHVPVTAELERTAFADATARSLLVRARAARLTQDSALQAYDAKTFQRLSVGLGFRRIGRDRLFLRSESAARVRWSRGAGVWVEPTGRRAVFPMVREAESEMDMTDATPIPYFPGRESLWIPSSRMGVAQAEVDEREMLHPLAAGAEAYYRYATGDSLGIRLPDGRRISLRELRITARRPDWRAFVGSFWFDVGSGSLVRAAYRMAAEMDVWQVAGEEGRRELEEAVAAAQRDTGAARARAIRDARRRHADDEPPALVKGMLNPMRATLSAITVEYGLYEGRFWLPKLNVAEGEVQAGFVRMPAKFEESFRYDRVNGDLHLPPVPAPAQPGSAGGDSASAAAITVTIGSDGARGVDTSAAGRAREDSLVRRYGVRADSLRGAAESARARGDTAAARRLLARAGRNEALARRLTRRREECARDSTYFGGVRTRYDGALRIATRLPCDPSRLAESPDLPGSIYEPGEALFGTAERDQLLSALDLSLQPGWGPQRPTLHTGLDLVRYNRIEGLSLAGTATSVLGRGYTARALGRIGTGDRVPNAELSIARSNGREEVRLGAFHRLGVANDDWGSPLSFGASVANLLYARDEGFYYRTFGAELAGSRDAPGPLGGATLLWRVFAERQRSAGVEPNTQLSLGHAWANAEFERNVAASQLTALGGGLVLARTLGADPMRFRLDGRVRAEAAATDRSDSVGTTGYGRLVLDATLSRTVGRIGAALTGAGGVSAGDLPVQRAFYLGGLQTVRGQFARPVGAGRVGDTFWMTRAELGLGLVSVRPVVFGDLGWAGARADLAHPGRPLSGAGVGASFLDGLVRFDVARGIFPERRTRLDMYLEARF